MAMRKDSYLHLYFHPWEFDDLESFNIPGYIKRLSGVKYIDRLEKLIVKLREEGRFSTISDLIESSGFPKQGDSKNQSISNL